MSRDENNRSGLTEFFLRLCSAEKWIHDQCSVRSRVGVVLGLSESSATWDSHLTNRAILLVWSCGDFLRGFNCYSFCIVLCLNNELRENFFSICHTNFSEEQVQIRVTDSFLKCHTSPRNYTQQRKQRLKWYVYISFSSTFSRNKQC